MPITRFAPSPTGFLHLGHAYSARMGYVAARGTGRFLLRIEDIDRTRCRREFETALLEDLAFLGLSWEAPVRRQSEHLGDYEAALATLDGLGVLYPCFCTRAEIAAEIAQAQGAPHDLPAIAEQLRIAGPHSELPSEITHRYPGTCRARSRSEAAARMASGNHYALRLDVEKALSHVRAQGGHRLDFFEQRFGIVEARPELFGDVVLARKDIRTSYHLAVTIDDHLQGVTLVTRGEDLFFATHIHRLLQALLGLSTPAYAHHPLLFDKDGQRLAKRHGARSLRELRNAGLSAAAIWAMAELPPLDAS